jgi:curli biogenesis system outer membrane secretion channel CsgG
MMMGMHKGSRNYFGKISKTQQVNTSQMVDAAIDETLIELASRNFNIHTVALWEIQTNTAGLNIELISQKLITQLVAMNRFRVIERKKLKQLLEEQNLSLSGAIDEKSAIDFGGLLGVEGFIAGYVSVEKKHFILNLRLIETNSGEIVWAKTTELPMVK